MASGSTSRAVVPAWLLALVAAAAPARAQSTEPLPPPPPPPSADASATAATSPSASRAAAHLQWVRASGAESCVDAARLAEQVTARLGRDPFAPDAPRHIEGAISREEGRFVARLFVRDEGGALRGSRELAHEGPSCAPLAAAVALAVALAIDPDAALRAQPAPPAPSPPTPPAPAPRAVIRPASRALPPPRPPPRAAPSAGVSARFVLAGLVLPVVAPGVALAVDARVAGPLRFDAGVTFLPEQQNPAPGDTRFAFGLTAASARACLEPFRYDRVALDACAGVHVGAIYAVVSRLSPVEPGARPWAAFGAGARLAVRLVGPLVLDASLELLVPPQRTRFYVEVPGRTAEETTVFLMPPVAVLGALGLGLAIW